MVWQSETNYPPVGSFVEKQGQKLHYIKSGAGQPLILIHGGGGSLFDWKMSCFDTLAKHFTAIAIDRPGFGYSSTLPQQSVKAQAEFLYHCLSDLSAQKSILVCHSRGAELGLYIALKYPGSIAGVITLGGATVNTEKIEPSWQYKLLQTPVIGRLLLHTFYIPVSKPFIRQALDKVFLPDRSAPQAYVDAYSAFLMRPQQFENWSKDNTHELLDNYLIPNFSRIKVPVVIVNGEKDADITLSVALSLHRQIAGSKLIVVPNTGHELHFNKPICIFWAINSLRQSRQ